MEISLLGAVQVTAQGRLVQVGGGKELVLLAVLGSVPGRPVAAEVLADRMWDGAPPPGWRETLYSYVNRTRRSLERGGVPRTVLRQDAGGYVIDITEDAVDWRRFVALRNRAGHNLHERGDPRAVDALTEALSLWRDQPLAGVPGRWARDMRHSMEQAHQAALVEWTQAIWHSARAEEVVGVLEDAVARYPLNEALNAQLMRALHRAGRAADALGLFHRLRQRLVEELGTDPQPHVRRVYEEILEVDRDLDAKHPPSTDTQVLGSVRTNLGRDLADFCDRHHETTAIRRAVLQSGKPDAAGVCVLNGMPGVGKTTLAVHVAHRLAHEFPDGRLFLDLQAHHEHQPPLPTSEALNQLLRLVGVPTNRLPGAIQERIALWRDYTADKRLLVVLDDAAETRQVVPLLPTGRGCGVIITSRRRLTDIDGAHPITVTVPSRPTAIAMLTTIARRPQPDQHANQVGVLAEHCGYLPLAMRLMASRLDRRPSWSLPDLNARLQTATDRLGEFRVGQRRLEAVFDVSLRSLTREAHAAFLRLGLHPTPSIDRDVATAMIGRETAEAEDAIDELVAANLLDEHDPGRYRVHALVTAYAYRQARNSLAPLEQHSVQQRMVEVYIRACEAADRIAYPHRLRLEREFPAAQFLALSPPPTRERALRWLSTHTLTLVTVIRHAARSNLEGHAAYLTHLLAEHLDNRGPWHLGVELHHRAQGIWHRLGDRAGLAQAGYELSRALLRQGDFDQAHAELARAHSLWHHEANELAEAWALDQRGLIAYVTGDHTQALQDHSTALETFERYSHQNGMALSRHRRAYCHRARGEMHAAITDLTEALNLQTYAGDTAAMIDTKLQLAGAHLYLGYHREATALCQEALSHAQQLNDRRREGAIRANLGEIAAYKMNHDRALQCFTDALHIIREEHDRWSEVVILGNLGTTCVNLGHLDDARAWFDQAQRLAQTFVNPGTMTEILMGYAEIHTLRDEFETARDYFQKAHDTATDAGLNRERAHALAAMGRLSLRQGLDAHAREQLHSAQELFDELSLPDGTYIRLLLDAVR